MVKRRFIGVTTTKDKSAILAVVGVVVIGILGVAALEPTAEPATDTSRLVSVQEFSETAMCADPPRVDPNLIASLGPELPSLGPEFVFAALQRQGQAAAAHGSPAGGRQYIRAIRDLHPTYSAIAVDLNVDEVILQDNNLWSYRVFNRLDNTPPGAEMTEPKRVVIGPNTAIQFNNGLYVDPKNGEIFSVESDVGQDGRLFQRE
jgi:hypothetical protein